MFEMNAAFDASSVSIETKRMTLRPWRASDLKDLYEYASMEDVGAMAGWIPHDSIETSRQVLQHYISRKTVLALELKNSGKVIGSVAIELGESENIPDHLFGLKLGYVLNKKYWGKGLMTEAVTSVIHYCFNTLKCDYLLCGHFLRNERSHRIIEKCGFSFLEEFDQIVGTGRTEHIVRYVLFNRDRHL